MLYNFSMCTTDQAVADNLRAEMARRRVTQSAVALALGMTQQSVSDRLRGRVPFSIGELTEVAGFIGVPVASLLPEAMAS